MNSDVQIMFEVMNQISPQRVLDVGGALVTNRVIARNLGEVSFPKQTSLYGVQISSKMFFPVFESLYDGIFWTWEEATATFFDVCVFLTENNEMLSRVRELKFKHALVMSEYKDFFEQNYNFLYEKNLSLGHANYIFLIECNNK